MALRVCQRRDASCLFKGTRTPTLPMSVEYKTRGSVTCETLMAGVLAKRATQNCVTTSPTYQWTTSLVVTTVIGVRKGLA